MPKGGRREGAGRPAGSLNEKTLTWQAFGRELLSRGVGRAQEIMDKADDDKFMRYFFELLRYFRAVPTSSDEKPEEFW